MIRRTLALLPLYVVVATSILLMVLMYTPDKTPLSPLNTGPLGTSMLVQVLSERVPTKIIVGTQIPHVNNDALVLVFVDNSTVSTVRDIVNTCRNCTVLVLPCSPTPSLGVTMVRAGEHNVRSMLAFVKFPSGKSVQIPAIGDKLPIVNTSQVQICHAHIYALASTLTILRKGKIVNITTTSIPVAAYCREDGSLIILFPTCYMLVNKLIEQENMPNRRYMRSLINFTRPSEAYIIYIVNSLEKDFLLNTRLALKSTLELCRQILMLVLVPVMLVYLIVLVCIFISRR